VYIYTGTQFTCFTSTKVQILTQKADSKIFRTPEREKLHYDEEEKREAEELEKSVERHSGTQFTCFTGTKVQILTQQALQPLLLAVSLPLTSLTNARCLILFIVCLYVVCMHVCMSVCLFVYVCVCVCIYIYII
jgi:hypothetical protein